MFYSFFSDRINEGFATGSKQGLKQLPVSRLLTIIQIYHQSCRAQILHCNAGLPFQVFYSIQWTGKPSVTVK